MLDRGHEDYNTWIQPCTIIQQLFLLLCFATSFPDNVLSPAMRIQMVLQLIYRFNDKRDV